MRLHLRTKCLRFTYTFQSGYQVQGRLEGDYFRPSPDMIFNLRSLNAVCLTPQGAPLMYCNEVFGQLRLASPEVILSGSQSLSRSHMPSFFSLNYRDEEATIYDSQTDQWLATGWSPENWEVMDETSASVIKRHASVVVPTGWSRRAIA